MITQVEVQNGRGETLAFPLSDNSRGYTVRGIEGLEPVGAIISSSPFALVDGEQYQASRLNKREIRLILGMDPMFSVQTLRAQLYRYFMPKSEVTLRFYVDEKLYAWIKTRVEDLDAPIFTEDPEATITCLAFDPKFVAPSSTVVSDLWVASPLERAVPYSGTVDTGFVFKLNVNRDITDLALSVRTPEGVSQIMTFVGQLLNGDILEISTVMGQKRVTRTRAGVTTSVLYGLSPDSPWARLYPGTNYIRASIAGASMPWTVDYTVKYGGL